MSQQGESGRSNAAVNILVGRLVEMRELYEKVKVEHEQRRVRLETQAQSIADVEAALVALGVDPAIAVSHI